MAAAIGVKLDQLAIKELRYREIDHPSESSPTGVDDDTKLNTRYKAQITVYPIGVELNIELELAPDPAAAPFEVFVSLSGYFRRPDEASDEAMVEFARSTGLLILFPYVREAVSDVTGRGRFGEVLLDPISVRRLLTATSRPPDHAEKG